MVKQTWLAGWLRVVAIACLGAGFVSWRSSPPPGQEKEPDYAALADDFVRSHLTAELLAGREPAAVSIEELLELAYVHLDLGALRIHYPKRAFSPPSRGKAEFLTWSGKSNPSLASKELSALAVAMAELQLRWIQLVGQEEPGQVIEARNADLALPGYAAVTEWLATSLRGKAEEKEILDALRKERETIDALGEGPPPAGFAEHVRFDLVDATTKEDDPVRAAFASFAATMRGGAYWDAAAKENAGAAAEAKALPLPKDVVICPTRGDLVGFALFAARERELPQLAWHAGIFEYTQLSLVGLQAIALHYAEEGSPQNLRAGTYMSDVDQPGGVVLQHAVSYATNMLLEHCFGPSYVGDEETTTPEQMRAQLQVGSLYGGVRKFMVTYLYGKNQIRDEGDEANRTQARSMFVAGGNSEGGSLGMMPAENSRWRKRANKDGDFIGDLLDNMEFERSGPGKDAYVRAKIVLQPLGSKKNNEHPATSPFLARVAKDVLPPVAGPSGEKDKDRDKRLQVRGDLARDYVGFLRAYEIAFYKWLVEEFQPPQGSSLESHAALYRAFAEIARSRLDPSGPAYDLSAELVAVVERVYGMPLTSEPVAGEDGPMTLEQSFLRWLSEQ